LGLKRKKRRSKSLAFGLSGTPSVIISAFRYTAILHQTKKIYIVLRINKNK
jgi:hypothetical protein